MIDEPEARCDGGVEAAGDGGHHRAALRLRSGAVLLGARLAVAALLLGAGACGGGGASPADGGPADARTLDAGTRDARVQDASSVRGERAVRWGDGLRWCLGAVLQWHRLRQRARVPEQREWRAHLPADRPPGHRHTLHAQRRLPDGHLSAGVPDHGWATRLLRPQRVHHPVHRCGRLRRGLDLRCSDWPAEQHLPVRVRDAADRDLRRPRRRLRRRRRLRARGGRAVCQCPGHGPRVSSRRVRLRRDVRRSVRRHGERSEQLRRLWSRLPFRGHVHGRYMRMPGRRARLWRSMREHGDRWAQLRRLRPHLSGCLRGRSLRCRRRGVRRSVS